MDQVAVYLIRISSPLAEADIGWFEGLTIAGSSAGDAILLTPAIDQAALYGILATLRDLALPLSAVQQLDPSPDHERDVCP
jgi:hypothetical protein